MDYILFKTKGVLQDKLSDKTKFIGTLSLLSVLIIIFIQVVLDLFYGINSYWVVFLIWVGLIYSAPHIFEKLPFVFLKIFALMPILLPVNIINGILILYYRKEYPNVSKEYAERYRKITKIMGSK